MNEKDMIIFVMILIYKLSVILGFISLAMWFNHWWLALFAGFFMCNFQWESNTTEDDKNG